MCIKDCVDRFFLRRIDERARVHHENVGFLGDGRDLHSALQNAAEHDFGIDQIFRAAETDHAHLRRRLLERRSVTAEARIGFAGLSAVTDRRSSRTVR